MKQDVLLSPVYKLFFTVFGGCVSDIGIAFNRVAALIQVWRNKCEISSRFNLDGREVSAYLQMTSAGNLFSGPVSVYSRETNAGSRKGKKESLFITNTNKSNKY